MVKQIFVNLAVKDLPKSIGFFERLGFSFNPQFTNEQGACLVLGDNIFAMLLTEPFFRTFTAKAIVDAKQATEVLTCVSVESRAKVDELVRLAVASGGRAHKEPQDHGFMYGHGFEDLDGHIWEVVHLTA